MPFVVATREFISHNCVKQVEAKISSIRDQRTKKQGNKETGKML